MLGIDRVEFRDEVRPFWKLGVRLQWGHPSRTHFNYPFDGNLKLPLRGYPSPQAYLALSDATDRTVFNVMMDRRLAHVGKSATVIGEGAAYHLKNDVFIRFLERKVKSKNVQFVYGEMVDVCRDPESGDVLSLQLSDGQSVEADLFVDCSGFRSALLGKVMESRYCSYENALYCDAAVVGGWQRNTAEDDYRPFTTVETMDHGWCWRIDFVDTVNRGYVFSTAFCTPEQAMEEMRQKNPRLRNELRLIRFPRGRHEQFWVKNVVAVGNAAAFVEPLEATALHLVMGHIFFVVSALLENDHNLVPAAIDLENQRYRDVWDDVRDFLAVHYKFNYHSDTPFWKHCRESTPLGGVEEFVKAFQDIGPTASLGSLLYPGSLFQFDGYVNMMIGQGVSTRARRQLRPDEEQLWMAVKQNNLKITQNALPVEKAVDAVYPGDR